MLCSPLVPGLDLGLVGPLGHVLQDMADAGGDMAAGMEMAGEGAAGMDMMAAMTPAMSMSFLLPGIGLGLLKGMLFGKKSSVKTTFNQLIIILAELFRDRQKSYGHSYGYQQPQHGYGYPQQGYGHQQQQYQPSPYANNIVKRR